jgi:hypothetical protein
MKRSTLFSHILRRLEGSQVLELPEVASGLPRSLTGQELKRVSGGQTSACYGGTSISDCGEDDSIDRPFPLLDL